MKYYAFNRHMYIHMMLVGLVLLSSSSQCTGLEWDVHGEGYNSVPIKKKKQKMVKKALVIKKNLKNGMTVLVRVIRTVPKVSIQVWYNVGSKDEKTGEKGIAHLIEHMVFKGTDKLSESDINFLAQKLSGSINAFTSYDYTGYLFDLPTHHWKEMLPIIADSMKAARFADDHLNSEMKAVIQELKMRRDNNLTTLANELLATIFPDHPYHYPIIGYKQDLWSVTGQDLKKFYYKHYVPNNATLVVVGDVNPDEVFSLAEHYFKDILPDNNYKKEKFYHNQDIISKSVTLYRDIKQPLAAVAWSVPGERAKNRYTFETIAWILGVGKSAHLSRKIVDELQLATSLAAFSWNLFDHGVFFIIYEPKLTEDIPLINKIIIEKIESIIKNGLTDHELQRAINQAKMKYYRTMENTQSQAYEIGQMFLATGDEQYAFTYFDESIKQLRQNVITMLRDYFRSSVMHTGCILSLSQDEKEQWKKLQAVSDEGDQKILSNRIRTSDVEPPVYAHTVSIKTPESFAFPKAQTATIPNGLKLLYHDVRVTPKIDLVLELKAKHYFDPDDQEGIGNFVMATITEGTKHYTAEELADELESRGISLRSYPGGVTMSMPREEFEIGLELLLEILTNAIFENKQVEKVRQQIVTGIKNFWDDPKLLSNQLVREKIYKGHPFKKNTLGTRNSIAGMTQQQLVNYYKKNIVPGGAKLAIVGDLSEYDVSALIKEKFSKWSGPEVPDIVFPPLSETKFLEVPYQINRDQIVVSFASLSVDRKHKDFDKLSLFDQILGGGVLGSLASRLFQLRERSGLFYTINGSLVSNASKQPGIILVKTIVSNDRLQEAEDAIKNLLETVVDTITEKELDEAKNAISNALVNNFESNSAIAQSFLFLDRYGFPSTYFDAYAQKLQNIKLSEVKKAVKDVLKPKNMITVRVGRVSELPLN